MSAASLTLISVSKVRRKQVWDSLIDGIVLFAYRAVESSGYDLFFIFFYDVQNQIALTYRAGQNIHKIFFH